MAVPKRLQYTLTLTPLKSQADLDPSQPWYLGPAADILATSLTEQLRKNVWNSPFEYGFFALKL